MKILSLSCIMGIILFILSWVWFELTGARECEYNYSNTEYVDVPESKLYEYNGFYLYWKIPPGYKMFITKKYTITGDLATGEEEWEEKEK